MKKVLFLLLITLGACSPRYAEYSYVSDYTKYVEEGFYIYPVGTDLKEANYIPVADIELSFRPGRVSKDALESGLSPLKFDSTDSDLYYSHKEVYIPSEEYIIEKIVNTAKYHKANGLINYQVVPIQNSKGATLMLKVRGTAIIINK